MRVFITGSNRGLGFEFTRQLLARGEQVFASCRKPDKAAGLTKLAQEHPDRLTILQLEVTDQEQIEAVAAKVDRMADGLDLLINNAGILYEGERFGSLESEQLLETLQVNSVAPVMVAQQFVPLLRKGEQPKVVNISSGLGSISMAGSSNYSYSASKAALNMFVKLMANTLMPEGITAIVMDPGWVQTDMGGKGAEITPEQSISGMLSVIDGLQLVDSGKFYHYSGSEVPW